MDRPRQILKWIASALGLLVISTALARLFIPYQPRAELKLPEHSEMLGFSPDGQILYTATSGTFKSGPIIGWDLQTGRQRFSLVGDWKDIMRIVFSADGRYVGAYQKEGGLKIWDARTGQEVEAPKPVTQDGNSVDFCFSPDGELLLVEDYRGNWSIMVWHIQDRREIGAIEDASLFSLIVSPDGQRLATWKIRDGGATIRLWQMVPFALVAEHHLCADALAVSSDLRRFATAESIGSAESYEFALWDMQKGIMLDSLVIEEPYGYLNYPILSDRGDHLLIQHYWHWSVGKWQVCGTTPRLRKVARFPARPALSPDGKLLAAPLPNGAELFVADGSAKLGEFVHPGDGPFPLPRRRPAYPAVSFSPDSRLVVVDGLWNLDSHRTLPTWITAYLPRKTHHVIRLWDTQSHREHFSLPDCYEARFTPDGKTLVTWHTDDFIQIWDYPFRQPLLLTAFCSLMFWLLMALPLAFVRKLRQ